MTESARSSGPYQMLGVPDLSSERTHHLALQQIHDRYVS